MAHRSIQAGRQACVCVSDFRWPSRLCTFFHSTHSQFQPIPTQWGLTSIPLPSSSVCSALLRRSTTPQPAACRLFTILRRTSPAMSWMGGDLRCPAWGHGAPALALHEMMNDQSLRGPPRAGGGRGRVRKRNRNQGQSPSPRRRCRRRLRLRRCRCRRVGVSLQLHCVCVGASVCQCIGLSAQSPVASRSRSTLSLLPHPIEGSLARLAARAQTQRSSPPARPRPLPRLPPCQTRRISFSPAPARTP